MMAANGASATMPAMEPGGEGSVCRPPLRPATLGQRENLTETSRQSLVHRSSPACPRECLPRGAP